MWRLAVVLGITALSAAPASAQESQASPVSITMTPDSTSVTIDLTGGGQSVRPATVAIELLVQNTTDDVISDAAVVLELPAALRHAEGPVVARNTGELGAAAIWREVIAVTVDPGAAIGTREIRPTASVTPAGGDIVSAASPVIGVVMISSTVVVPVPTTSAPPAEVKGVVYERPQPRAQLPRTGRGVAVFASLALALLTAGGLFVRAGRR